MAFNGKVTEDNVYTCVGHPLRSDIENMVTWMLNLSFAEASQKISHLKTLKGLALQDILTQIHLYVHRIDFPGKGLVVFYLFGSVWCVLDSSPSVRRSRS